MKFTSSLQEYLQEQFVGKDKTKISIKDDIFKTIKEGWDKKLGYVPERPMALITVFEPETPNILESIGCSEPNDLLTDIWGAAFAGMVNGGAFTPKLLSDENGVVRTAFMQDSGGSQFSRNDDHGACGTSMRIGRGGVILRSDFNLTDPYVVAPESNRFGISTSGGWISGLQQVVVNGLLANVTTSDTIGECGLFMQWNAQTAVNVFMISHDAAAGSFTSGQNVNVTYTWSIT